MKDEDISHVSFLMFHFPFSLVLPGLHVVSKMKNGK